LFTGTLSPKTFFLTTISTLKYVISAFQHPQEETIKQVSAKPSLGHLDIRHLKLQAAKIIQGQLQTFLPLQFLCFL
jgi:hypothetical protein